MLWFLVVYVVIGLILSYGIIIADNYGMDVRAITQPLPTLLITTLWPAILVWMALHVRNLKWKGKIVWERKRK